MTKTESILENETHKNVWNFKTQTHYSFLARRPDNLVLINPIYQPLRSGRIWHKVNF